MTYILKDAQGNILTYSETSQVPDMDGAETLQYIDVPFFEYSRRLVLSHKGKVCSTVLAAQGDPDVEIDVSTNLNLQGVDLNINGVVETVPISIGFGKLILSTAHHGIFIIIPADRKTFCAAGKSIIAVEVIPNA